MNGTTLFVILIAGLALFLTNGGWPILKQYFATLSAQLPKQAQDVVTKVEDSTAKVNADLKAYLADRIAQPQPVKSDPNAEIHAQVDHWLALKAVIEDIEGVGALNVLRNRILNAEPAKQDAPATGAK